MKVKAGLYQFSYEVDPSTAVVYTVERNSEGAYPTLDRWVLIADIGDEHMVFDDDYPTKNHALADVQRLAGNWYNDPKLGWCLRPHKQEQAEAGLHCRNCQGFCPSGTLPNGLCSDCDLIGKKVACLWGGFGWKTVKITRVTKAGNVYGRRWIKNGQRWGSERKIERRGKHWERG